MKQLVTLFMAGTLLASVPVVASEDFSAENSMDEYSATLDQQIPMDAEELLFPPGDGRGGDRWGRPGRDRDHRRRWCPPGTHRRAEYRWDRRHRRWVFVGWTCRRGRFLQNEAADISQ